PDAELLESAGFIECGEHVANEDVAEAGEAAQPQPRTIPIDAPLLLFHFDNDGKLHKYGVIVREPRGEGEYTVEIAAASPGVSSRSFGMAVNERAWTPLDWSLPDQTTPIRIRKVAGQPMLEV